MVSDYTEFRGGRCGKRHQPLRLRKSFRVMKTSRNSPINPECPVPPRFFVSPCPAPADMYAGFHVCRLAGTSVFSVKAR
jgi:hypothetical protein